jgi:hypothetical protein
MTGWWKPQCRCRCAVETEPPVVDWVWRRELEADEPYIDADWLNTLKGLRFRFGKEELEYVDLRGYGSKNVAFGVEDAQGKRWVITMTRELWVFPSYVRELPPHLSLGRPQDPERLMRKLDRLIGDPMMDRIVRAYDGLYRTLVDNLHAWPPLDTTTFNDEVMGEFFWFGARAPGTLALLERLASASRARPETVAWARQTANLLRRERIGPDPSLRPETLHANPLYVFGGAHLEGFFGNDSTRAVDRVCSHLAVHPTEFQTFAVQALALSELLRLLRIPGAEGFAKLYEATGKRFEESVD